MKSMLRRVIEAIRNEPVPPAKTEPTFPFGDLVHPLTPSAKPALPPDMPPQLRHLIEQLQAKGATVVVGGAEPPPVAPASNPDLWNGVTTRTIESMPWEKWSQVMGEVGGPGWIPCQIGVRTGNDTVCFYVGASRGSFGVHSTAIDCCEVDDAGRHFSSQSNVSFLTHLPSGYQFGIFEAKQLAMQCAEIADRTGDWSSTQVDDANVDRAHEGWKAIGLIYDPNRHTHFGSKIVGIFKLEDDEKPKVLS